MAKLSTRAKKILERIKKGHWYVAYGKRTPKAIKELEDAGLITITGRVEVIRAAYVPTTGYTPYKEEQFLDG